MSATIPGLIIGSNIRNAFLQNNKKHHEVLRISSYSLAAQPYDTTKLESGYAYKFPNVIISGPVTLKKTLLMHSLCGIHGINLTSHKKLKISFIKTNCSEDYIKIGKIGGKTYQLHNAIRRLEDENNSNTTKSIEIKMYSSAIKREYVLIINPGNHTNEADNIIDIESIRMHILNEQIRRAVIIPTQNNLTVETETYESYLENIVEYAKNQDKTWILNIFAGNTTRTILYQDDDIVLTPDQKWTNKNLNNIHCLALFKNPNLMSIRDLNDSNISLLTNIVRICKEVIEKTYNIKDIDLYFHYHPSIWQLHMHLSKNIKDNHKKYMVTDVINNLTISTNYYKANSLEI